MGATSACHGAGLAKFGDHEAATKLLMEVGKGTHLAESLATVPHTRGAFGIERAPVVKGQAMPRMIRVRSRASA